jgi:hypothetical protein
MFLDTFNDFFGEYATYFQSGIKQLITVDGINSGPGLFSQVNGIIQCMSGFLGAIQREKNIGDFHKSLDLRFNMKASLSAVTYKSKKI